MTKLGLRYATRVKTADNVQKYKYTLHNVAPSYGKTLTFMPKPLYGDNGSGMPCHQPIWKDNKPLVAGSGSTDLSETALPYIRRNITHPQASTAFPQPHTHPTQPANPDFSPTRPPA